LDIEKLFIFPKSVVSKTGYCKKQKTKNKKQKKKKKKERMKETKNAIVSE
jgi:hypothetical protein